MEVVMYQLRSNKENNQKPKPIRTGHKNKKDNKNYDLILMEALSNDSHITINKSLAKAIGILEAYLFSDLITKYKYFKDRNQLVNGYFFNTSENIERDTSLSYYQQNRIIKQLTNLNLIETKILGLPPKQHFKINFQETLILILKKLEDINSRNLSFHNNKNKIIRIKNKDSKESITVSDETEYPSSVYLDKWNSLPSVQKHKSPKTKTYQKARKYFSQLFRGKFWNNKVLDQEWWDKCNFPPEWKTKRWSKSELLAGIETLGLLFIEGYWPYDKSKLPRSLADLIYNSKTGKSMFLQVMIKPPKQLRNYTLLDQFPKLTKLVTDRLHIKSSKQLVQSISQIVEFNKSLYRENTPKHKKYMTTPLSIDRAKVINTKLPLDKPEIMIKSFLRFLEFQDWIDKYTSSLFRVEGKVFRMWVEDISRDIGVHIVTGELQD